MILLGGLALFAVCILYLMLPRRARRSRGVSLAFVFVSTFLSAALGRRRRRIW